MLEVFHRTGKHRIGRGARGQRAEHRFPQQEDFRKQLRARLIDVAMDQVLQAAGLALHHRQDLVGLANLADFIPGAVQPPRAGPDHRCERQHDGGVQCRDRQDAPADRDRPHRIDQPGPAREVHVQVGWSRAVLVDH
jgi:hypothetical protein